MALHVLNLMENAFYKKSSEKLRIKNSLGEGVQSNYTIGSKTKALSSVIQNMPQLDINI